MVKYIEQSNIKDLLKAYNLYKFGDFNCALFVLETTASNPNLKVYDAQGYDVLTKTLVVKSRKHTYVAAWIVSNLLHSLNFELSSDKNVLPKLKIEESQARDLSSKTNLLSVLGNILSSSVETKKDEWCEFLLAIPKPDNKVLFIGESKNELDKKPILSLVVPIFKNLNYLQTQINHLENDSWFVQNGELILIHDDPDSIENYVDFYKKIIFSTKIRLKFFSNSKNVGFSASNNNGAARTKSTYIGFVNSDVVFRNDFSFLKLINLLKSEKNIGMVTCPLVDEFGAIQHIWMEEFLNDNGDWENSHPYTRMFLQDIFPKQDNVKEIDICTGALVLMNKELLLEVGGWDESFIVGDFEDNVLCHIIKSLGKKICTDLSQSAFHFEGSSFERNIYKHKVNSVIYGEKRKIIVKND